MLKAIGRISVTSVAYMCFLLGFVALGTFVYALAAGSPVAGIIGGTLVALLVATVVLFRAGARKLVESNESGIEIPGVNIFAKPLRREQIDHYLLSYRGVQNDPEETAAVESEPSAVLERRAA
ncbi:hypothetical protein ACQI4L_14225 [Mycolicibacterium litorale]|uniref:hypothetical protein n=1 Tax=Mycolicibacterium litorale TaxID=758802 RepID=UPI003CEF6D1A